MIKINQNHLNRFKRNNCEYLYYVSKGLFLAFDINTLEYIGIEMYYLPADYVKINNRCENKINELIAKDVLEVYYD